MNPDAPLQEAIVFLVDDEADILKALKRELGRMPMKLQCFGSAREALAAMQQIRPDVLLSDVRMPDMDGVELMQQAAAIHPLCERILITGFADSQAVINAINRGHVHYFLEKPWDSQRLRNVLRKGVELTQVRRRNLHLESVLSIQNTQLKQLNASLESRVEKRTEKLKQAYTATLDGFCSLVEKRFVEAAPTQKLLRQLLTRFCDALDINNTQRGYLQMAGRLRNLGKITLPDAVFQTPYKLLNDKQKSLYHQHPLIAASTLALIPPLREPAQLISMQAERGDGSGFPRHISLHQFPLAAQILAAATLLTDNACGRYDGESRKLSEAWTLVAKQAKHWYSEPVLKAIPLVIKDLSGSQGSHSYLEVDQLVVGMRLADDLLSDYGVLLLPAGHTLDPDTIDSLRQLQANADAKLRLAIELIDDQTELPNA